MNERVVIQSFMAAVVLAPSLVAVHIVFFRFLRGAPGPALLFLSLAAYALLWLAVFKHWIEPQGFYWPAVVCSLATILFFFLGYMEFFSMVCRGFSLRIMVDIERKGSLSLREITSTYGGQGVEWMFSKRLETLRSMGLIETTSQDINLKGPLARVLGNIGNGFKDFLKMGKGG